MQFFRRLNANPFFTVDYRRLARLANVAPRGCLARINQWITSLLRWVMPAAGLLMFAYQIFYALRGQLPPLPVRTSQAQEVFWIVSVAFLMFGGLMYHFSVVMPTSRLAATLLISDKRVISRWELLLLTGLDARTFLRGKWWAVVRLKWREWLLLGVARGGLIVGLVPILFRSPYSSASIVPYTIWELLAAFVLIVVLTMANLLWTAALGVVNPMMYPRGGQPGSEVGLRIGLLLMMGAMWCPLTSLLTTAYRLPIDYAFTVILTVVGIAMWTIADNGFILAATLMTPNYVYVYSTSVTSLREGLYLLGASVLALALYLLLTALLLRAAEWWGKRYGMITIQEAQSASLSAPTSFQRAPSGISAPETG